MKQMIETKLAKALIYAIEIVKQQNGIVIYEQITPIIQWKEDI